MEWGMNNLFGALKKLYILQSITIKLFISKFITNKSYILKPFKHELLSYSNLFELI